MVDVVIMEQLAKKARGNLNAASKANRKTVIWRIGALRTVSSLAGRTKE